MVYIYYDNKILSYFQTPQNGAVYFFRKLFENGNCNLPQYPNIEGLITQANLKPIEPPQEPKSVLVRNIASSFDYLEEEDTIFATLRSLGQFKDIDSDILQYWVAHINAARVIYDAIKCDVQSFLFRCQELPSFIQTMPVLGDNPIVMEPYNNGSVLSFTVRYNYRLAFIN